MTSAISFQAAPPPANATRFDARCICNAILDFADDMGVEVTHLALQKLLFFTHAAYLLKTKTPLTSGYFEAWKYGPVHTGAYMAFKGAGCRPIKFRAERQDPFSGKRSPIPELADPAALSVINHVVGFQGRLPAAQLVAMSQAKGGPWHMVVERVSSLLSLNLRISDDMIAERSRYHKVAITDDLSMAEPTLDQPFP
jgi:uncharacterized phage-associated protein